MSYKRKCFVGYSFHSFDDLLKWIDLHYWVFLGKKAIHPSFVRNRSLISVRAMQKSGYIRQCFDAYGEPYITDRLILDESNRRALGLDLKTTNETYEKNKPEDHSCFFDCIVTFDGTYHKFAPDAKKGSLCKCGEVTLERSEYYAPFCAEDNRFVSEEIQETQKCNHCHRSVPMFPITYSEDSSL